jgi:hypothetical protein
MIQQMVMKFIEPHLDKIPKWLNDMAKEFGVEQCYLMIMSKPNEEGKEIPTMVVMGKKDGGLIVVKDKEGKQLEYGIESLLGFAGASSDED